MIYRSNLYFSNMEEINKKADLAEALINEFGAVYLAKLFEITPSAIYQWKRNGVGRGRLAYLELLHKKKIKQIKQGLGLAPKK